MKIKIILLSILGMVGLLLINFLGLKGKEAELALMIVGFSLVLVFIIMLILEVIYDETETNKLIDKAFKIKEDK